MATFCSTTDTNPRQGQVGPVTAAIAAMGKEPEPPRRGFLKTAGVVLAGVVLGAPAYRANSADLVAVAEAWLEDARDLGMYIVKGPDGHFWRSQPIGDSEERADARDRLWFKLNNRPPLMRAVYAAVERGFAY